MKTKMRKKLILLGILLINLTILSCGNGNKSFEKNTMIEKNDTIIYLKNGQDSLIPVKIINYYPEIFKYVSDTDISFSIKDLSIKSKNLCNYPLSYIPTEIIIGQGPTNLIKYNFIFDINLKFRAKNSFGMEKEITNSDIYYSSKEKNKAEKIINEWQEELNLLLDSVLDSDM